MAIAKTNEPKVGPQKINLVAVFKTNGLTDWNQGRKRRQRESDVHIAGESAKYHFEYD